jgi:hypothetical protein
MARKLTKKEKWAVGGGAAAVVAVVAAVLYERHKSASSSSSPAGPAAPSGGGTAPGTGDLNTSGGDPTNPNTDTQAGDGTPAD